MNIKLIKVIIIYSIFVFSLFAQEKIYQQFADSEIKRFPEAWQLDSGTQPYFGYTQGLGSLAMLKVWKATGEEKYYDYVFRYADHMIQEDGSILNYDLAWVEIHIAMEVTNIISMKKSEKMMPRQQALLLWVVLS